MKKKAKPNEFGKQVKIKLIKLDMTQVELAKLLGIQKQYLNKILKGERTGHKYLSTIKSILGMNDAA